MYVKNHDLERLWAQQLEAARQAFVSAGTQSEQSMQIARIYSQLAACAHDRKEFAIRTLQSLILSKALRPNPRLQ